MKKTSFKTQLPRLTLVAVLLAGSYLTAPALHAQNLPTLGDTGREDLSPVMERKLGEEIMLGIRADPDYIDDEVAAEYLNDFGSRLLEVHQEARGDANFDFYFFTVRDPMINAFALPGGFIAVHSALVVLAQNESELASVLAHEIGHIAQRHIARMIGNQKQDFLIPIASLILAALTMRSNPDAAMAVAIGGEGLAVQRQLDFSQNAEREADRVGLQILRDGGYDPSGMVAFFERMQSSSRGYSDNFPAFLRTHPMTSERIADIQSRIQSETFKKHIDSPDFQLFRSRIRVLQDESAQALLETKSYFEDQITHAISLKKPYPAAEYGLAFIAFKQNNFKEAQVYLDKARKESGRETGNDVSSLFFTSLQLDILLRSKQNPAALKAAELALQEFPVSRGIGRQYTDALIANQHGEQAITYLRDQTLLYRKDFGLQEQLAKAYAAEGKEALQHLALAESYALSGAISPALDQLDIARRSPDATYYDHAIIDARERDLRERYKDELEALKKQGDKK
ncbi:M48 family metallopeptidase [Solimicrobium silvestre]|uniref:Putative Zn-dependent protease contains TPR repeat n=1 Tax=Solimicrobium silvestre TaxID=2099400 RepID=A0A2S9GXF0_9BURK|nr:M48 family metalloprotease [Solimicrobium silvestre]PRC92395.1 putative Zn-dependent protease contains TPR repeat [Solimicrobium silvestre]